MKRPAAPKRVRKPRKAAAKARPARASSAKPSPPKDKPTTSKAISLPSSMTRAELIAEFRRVSAEADKLRMRIELLGKTRKRLSDVRHTVDEIIASAPFGAHIYELRSGRLVFIGANKAADRILGIEHEALRGMLVEDAFPSMLDSELLARLRQIAEHEGRLEDERFSYSDDRIVGAFEVSAFNIARRRVACFFRDITERKTSEARQIQANKNIETILESTPYGVVIIAKDKTVIHANRAALSAMGYKSVGEIVGSVCHETLCPAQADKCPILDLGQKLDRSEKLLITKDGRRVPILKTVVPVMFDDEELLLEAFVDISERKQAEDFIKSILESIDDSLLVIGRDYSIISANRAFCESSGIKQADVIGRKCYAITHGMGEPCGGEDHECPVRVTFETGESCVVTHTHRDAEGGESIVEVKSYPLKDISGNVTSVIEVQNDITERLSIEEQLRHSQKMDALGTLTGGIAHEFNNIITAIMGFGEFLHDELEGQDSLRGYADMIVKSATRAAKLTEGLLAYSRKQITHMEPLDIDRLVMSMSEFLERLVGSGVSLSMSACSGATVMADKAQMEQVLVNLVKNASDAMPSGGSISISLTGRSVEPDSEEALAGVRPGEYALMEVVDTGHGIDEETIRKIFEPFFTTKDVGKGTGLGLSMVYGIVEKHGGHVTVSSQPGEGATFSVYLPKTKAALRAAAQERAKRQRSGSGTILIAEDDESIRQLMQHALGNEGYNVLVASGGREAVDTFMRYSGSIVMLIFVVVMPGMGGYEAYELIRAHSPGIKVAFVSGCMAGDERLAEIVKHGHLLISKPISPRRLLQKVQEAL